MLRLFEYGDWLTGVVGKATGRAVRRSQRSSSSRREQCCVHPGDIAQSGIVGQEDEAAMAVPRVW